MAVPWVQGTAVLSIGTTTVLPLPLSAAVGTGDLLCVAYGWTTTSDTATVTDTALNTYTSITPVISGGELWSVAYCASSKGPTSTITVTKTGASATMLASVDQYRGGFTFLGSNSGTAVNVNPFIVPAITTANTGDLIFGVGVSISGFGITSGAGFTQREALSNALLTEDQFLVAAGSATATFATAGNDSYIGFVLDFSFAQPPPFGMPRFAITYRTW